MKTAILITLAIILAAAAADTSHAQPMIWPGDTHPTPRPDTTRPNGTACPRDPFTCLLLSTTRFECGTGDALLCWFGEYRRPGSDANPPINEGW